MEIPDNILRSSEFWAELTGVLVYDPDGWDRQDFENSWAEPISLKEFKERVWSSTINFNSLEAMGWRN